MMIAEARNNGPCMVCLVMVNNNNERSFLGSVNVYRVSTVT